MKKCMLNICLSLIVLSGYCYAGQCTATAQFSGADIFVHIPGISLNGASYSADLTYVPANDGYYWFSVKNLVVDSLSCGSSSTTLIPVGANLEVLVPDLNLNNVSYWVKFLYFPSTDGKIWLVLLNLGPNSSAGNIVGNIVFHPASNAIKYSYYHYIPESALKRKPLRILLYTHGSGRINTYAEMEQFILNTEIPRIKPYCDKYGYALVVMVTPRNFNNYPDYKMNTYNMVRWVMFNNSFDKPEYEFYKRPDLVFVKVIDDFIGFLRTSGVAVHDKVFMTGFSAGGFQADRFPVLRPDKVAATAAGGAGAFLYPTETWNGASLTYPIGTFDIAQISDNTYSLDALRRIPHFIFIGGSDTNDPVGQNDMFDTDHSAVINSNFGTTMSARNQMCSDYLNSVGIPSTVKIYPGIAHVYNNEMLTDSFTFFDAVPTEVYPKKCPGCR